MPEPGTDSGQRRRLEDQRLASRLAENSLVKVTTLGAILGLAITSTWMIADYKFTQERRMDTMQKSIMEILENQKRQGWTRSMQYAWCLRAEARNRELPFDCPSPYDIEPSSLR